jgi:predicted component of type VI protein secretion system
VVHTFRERYPTGGILTDLLRVEQGLFVVRAEIRVDDRTILATGLAAAADLEEAEERAIERAFEHLATQNRGRNGWNPELSERAERSLARTVESVESGRPRRSMNGSFKGAEAGSLARSEALNEALSEEFDTLDLGEAKDLSPQRLNSLNKNFVEPSVSMDLSELIAQTNVEMKRIGWMAKQGQDYLQRTFGKRSRQQLDDDELAEFLEFLKSQPTQMANRRPQAPF